MTDSPTHNIYMFIEKREISCPETSTILECTLAANVDHTHACGGKGKCSTCRVSIMEGVENCTPRNEAEQVIAGKFCFPEDVRLACQTRINGDVTIRRIIADKVDMDIIFEQFSQNSKMALGSQQELTMVFTDIENYTTFAEKFPSYDIVHILNRYYKIMNALIEEHKGFISDIAGDGILAVFGADNECENSVLDAIKAVREMNKKLKLFNEYLEENYNTQFGLRAGIHYGSVILGPFDTGSMKKLAVIGDNVNYASRIESANKEFGTKLLLSEEAYAQIEDHFPNSNVFETTLKGKTGTYRLHEIS